MEQKDLVEKLTKEVIARLTQEGSGVTGGAPAGGSRTTASGGVGGNMGGGRSSGAVQEGGSAQAAGSGELRPSDLNKYIDHTLLKPEATKEQIDKLCDEAKEYSFYSVCVNSSWVEYCAKKLRGSGVKISAVVGFPLGAMEGRAKGYETRHVVEAGADEIDMVMNVGALKSGDTKKVEEDIRWVRRSTRQKTVVKVIIEAALLTDDEKVLACQISKNAGADFVKTSTGFAKGGATAEDVALMRRTVGPKTGVKAAGGIRSFEDAVKMINAGATRLGTSSSVEIVTGQKSTSAY
jgi:deoxyribose-phosphate aldolase